MTNESLIYADKFTNYFHDFQFERVVHFFKTKLSILLRFTEFKHNHSVTMGNRIGKLFGTVLQSLLFLLLLLWFSFLPSSCFSSNYNMMTDLPRITFMVYDLNLLFFYFIRSSQLFR